MTNEQKVYFEGISVDKAREVFNTGRQEVFRLYGDDAEAVICEIEEIVDEGVYGLWKWKLSMCKYR